jgi:peptidoglycan hydrolase-like protein with peptidoglycan-binding domain
VSQSQPAQPKPAAAPAPKPEAPPYDQKIANLQTLLIKAGQDVEVTGFMDAQTKKAVIAFQRAHGLAADGVAGPRTLQVMHKVAARSAEAKPTPVSAPAPSGPPTGCAATSEFTQYSSVIARIDCPGHNYSGAADDQYVDVYIYEQAWLETNHYDRVGFRDLLEKAFQRNARLIAADSGQPLDVNGGAR